MKYKFIREIRIGDQVFKVKWDKSPNRILGNFHYATDKKCACIAIGTMYLKTNPESVLSAIIHELKEIIQIEQSTRYNRTDGDNIHEFHYTHREHTDLCNRLAGLLFKFIK